MDTRRPRPELYFIIPSKHDDSQYPEYQFFMAATLVSFITGGLHNPNDCYTGNIGDHS
jgi:hypothetical protein